MPASINDPDVSSKKKKKNPWRQLVASCLFPLQVWHIQSINVWLMWECAYMPVVCEGFQESLDDWSLSR